MESLLTEIKGKYEGELDIEVIDDSLCFKHPSTDIEITLSKDSLDECGSEEEAVNKILKILGLNYITGDCLFDETYFEAIVMVSESHYVDVGDVCIVDEHADPDGTHYEISSSSEEFCYFFDGERAFDYVEADHLTTIKLYNINNIIHFEDRSKFIDSCKELCKSIFFDICRRSSVALELAALSEDDSDPFAEIPDKLEVINKTSIVQDYDKDLINYYYRGSRMETSQFKYLSFYQVLECIFDEVYLYETTQDVKSILNSSWFDPRKDDNAQKVISIVERYNKEKNDKAKLLLVLQRFFRGDTHDDVFVAANSEVIGILKDLGEIKKDEEIKDLQKLVGIIYDFRCSCTHSNRKFPKPSVPHANDSLELYINLAKKIAETVIVNYR